VDTFPPNDFGLYNMTGTAWEWTADWFSPTWHLNGPSRTRRGRPRGSAERCAAGPISAMRRTATATRCRPGRPIPPTVAPATSASDVPRTPSLGFL
jgi:formylglycine-generating enzyme required for sulfatase activity